MLINQINTGVTKTKENARSDTLVRRDREGGGACAYDVTSEGTRFEEECELLQRIVWCPGVGLTYNKFQSELTGYKEDRR